MSFQKEFETINDEYTNTEVEVQAPSMLETIKRHASRINLYILAIPIIIAGLLYFVIKPSYVFHHHADPSKMKVNIKKIILSVVVLTIVAIAGLYMYSPTMVLN